MIPHVMGQIRGARDHLFKLLQESDVGVEVVSEIPPVILEARSQLERANNLLQDVPSGTRAGSDDCSISSDATEY
jgi:hypothetical protein